MTRAGTLSAGAATVVAAGSLGVLGFGAWGPHPTIDTWELAVELIDLVPFALGWAVVRAAPLSPVGPALTWTSAAVLAVRTTAPWAASAATTHPWPGAGLAVRLDVALWPWQLMGLLALVLVFPDGLLPGRRWRVVAALGPLAATVITTVLLLGDPDTVPAGWLPVLFAGLAGLLAALVAAVVGLVVRYRRGGSATRQQLRWLLAAAASVPALLAAGWLLEMVFGAPVEVAYVGFLVGMLVLVPVAVTVAVLRHDLLDVDRLVGATLAGVATAVVSAGVFAGVVVLAGRALAAPTGLSTTAAAFATALCLLPLHARLSRLIGRVTDRERTVLLGAVHRFTEGVRDGTAEPEQVEAALGAVLDADVRLALVPPGRDGLVDLAGRPFGVPPGATTISLRERDAEVGVLVLARATARRRRLATEAAMVARLPIEVSRLRLGLRSSLAEVTASRARLAEAVAAERHRLERDLHDGAQQHVVAVGMRLRLLQARLEGRPEVHAELDRAVAALEDTVAELRRVAHGIRPSRLDDGLAAALQDLARASPVPLQLTVEDAAPADLDEAVETTAYFVVAEALANAWKHARAEHVEVRVARTGGRTVVEVCDDGVGGVDPARSLTALRDRVGSLGGRLEVLSPAGGGTRLTAVI
jgi:signal transduction histidine kinase